MRHAQGACTRAQDPGRLAKALTRKVDHRLRIIDLHGTETIHIVELFPVRGHVRQEHGVSGFDKTLPIADQKNIPVLADKGLAKA